MLDAVPEAVRETKVVFGFSVHLLDKLGTLLLVAGFPAFLLAFDGVVVDDLATRAAREGHGFIG